MSLSANFLPKKFSRANTKRIIHNELRHSKTNRLRYEAMNNERVTPKNAAKELQMDVITLRELMKREKLHSERVNPSGDFTYIATFWIRRKNDLV